MGKEQMATLVTGEGEWWMAFTDFLRCFTHLSICHIQPEDLDNTTAEDVIWIEKSVHGQWVAGLTGNDGNDGITSFLTNPQYLLSIRKEEERVEVSMALMQMGRRQLRDEMGNNTFLAIGINVHR